MAALETSTIANLTSVVATANYSMSADDKQLATVQATYTVTTASFSLQLQYSFDNSNWINDGSAQAVSATGAKTWAPTYVAPYYRVASTRTSGTLDTLKIWAVYKPF